MYHEKRMRFNCTMCRLCFNRTVLPSATLEYYSHYNETFPAPIGVLMRFLMFSSCHEEDEETKSQKAQMENDVAYEEQLEGQGEYVTSEAGLNVNSELF